MVMIFQLSDWFPKPIIWTIIVTFDQIRKNWWRISCAGREKIFRGVVGKENVTICGGFTRWNQWIAWKFTKTVILLGLAGYELIITASLVIYISSYPARPRRITVNYIILQRLAHLTLKLVFLTGTRLAQHLTTSQPMVTTLRLAEEVSLPINRDIGGLGEVRTDRPNRWERDRYKEMLPQEPLLLHPLGLLVDISLS